MTPDELPSPPRKASWKRWTLTLACMLAITLAVLLRKAPTPEPVSVRFAGSTNDNGFKMLIFKGTNGLSRGISFRAIAVLEPADRILTNGSAFFFRHAKGVEVPAGETFTFPLEAPPNDPKWHVTWYFVDRVHVPTRWDKVRRGCYRFLTTHGMPTLARPFADSIHMHYILPTELEE